MKRRLTILLALVCTAVIAFAGCTKENSSADDESDKTSVVSESSGALENSNVADATHSSPVDAQWFDDAVFVGDSVTLKLSYYCDKTPDALGKAQFFCAGSLGYTSALWDLNHENAVHPYYKGKTCLTENCAVETGANKVFVMLGMNDIGLYGIDDSMKSADELISRIVKNSPDAKIYVQSVTPILMGKESESLNNEKIREFNKKLESYCADKSYKYLDVYNLLADKDGYLPLEYCGDEGAMGIHFNDTSCAMWVDFLKNNV